MSGPSSSSGKSSGRIYKLLTTDNQIFEMTREDMSHGTVLAGVAALTDTKSGLSINDPIEMPRVNSDVMRLIQRWCQMCRVDNPTTSNWKEEFLSELPDKEIHGFLLMGEHLGMKSLVEAAKKYLDGRIREQQKSKKKKTPTTPGSSKKSGSGGPPRKTI
ncbi:unnamed protein product [Caenorhabditis nigoni]